jgi:hypothetical protein
MACLSTLCILLGYSKVLPHIDTRNGNSQDAIIESKGDSALDIYQNIVAIVYIQVWEIIGRLTPMEGD